MLKSITTSYLILATLLALFSTPGLGQPRNEASSKDTESVALSDLQKVFAKEAEEVRAGEAVFDPVKLDRERGNRQAQKKGWSKTQKVLAYTALAVGVAALLFLVIKYGKDCIRSEPADCTPGVDENCRCLEYERRVQN